MPVAMVWSLFRSVANSRLSSAARKKGAACWGKRCARSKAAEALAAACLGLLDQNAAYANYVASLPSWLQGFDAGNRLAGAAWHGVGFLQKDKKYAEANEVLRALMKHGYRRAACHERHERRDGRRLMRGGVGAG